MGQITTKVQPLSASEDFKSAPTYYTNSVPTHVEYIRASESWKLILDGNGRHYKSMVDHHQLQMPCIVWFSKTLYDNLFSVLPEIKPLFKKSQLYPTAHTRYDQYSGHNQETNKRNSVTQEVLFAASHTELQGIMITNMISSMLEAFYNPTVLHTIHNLTVRHIGYGVRAHHFYVMGDVLFFTLHQVLNSEYTPECDIAWKKMYSSILRVIIPLCKITDEHYIINRMMEYKNIFSSKKTSNKPESQTKVPRNLASGSKL
jgi:hemoglobin-like flavoprotein